VSRAAAAVLLGSTTSSDSCETLLLLGRGNGVTEGLIGVALGYDQHTQLASLATLAVRDVLGNSGLD